MTSYRRSVPLPHRACAGESGGAYDGGGHDRDRGRDPDDPGAAGSSPLGGLADALDELEQVKRKVLDRMRDVAAWGGTATTTGYTHGEWLALVGRLPGRESWTYELLVSRLPGCPVTAALLDRGQLSIDQAISIVVGTKRLTGDALARVEATAAHAAADRNRRGDDPDIDADVDLLVRETRTAADQDRRDRALLDRNSVRIQPDLFGSGRITEDWTDAEGFQTRVAAIEAAAGPPTPDTPRGTQLAEGSLATARAWLAGRPTPKPTTTNAGDGDGGGGADGTWLVDPRDLDLLPSAARPTFVVRIDITDLDGIDPHDPDTLRTLATGSGAAFGRLAAAGRLSSTPWLGRQLLDTLACNLDLIIAVVDGARPLAEFRHTRRLPDRIRRQVLWRDLGCRWPACRAPIAHCDVHHLDQHPTNHQVDNLLTLCRRHHRRLHTTYWHPHLDGHTARFDLLRTPGGHPVHTTHPRGTHPRQTLTATATTSGTDPPHMP